MKTTGRHGGAGRRVLLMNFSILIDGALRGEDCQWTNASDSER